MFSRTRSNFIVRQLKQYSNFGLNAPYMAGIESPEEWPNITRGLVSRGYSDQEIEKILGGNAMNLMKKVIG
ncbi:MAG: membrane dipeptidase [Candidatus Hodarchaeales archaeon]